MPSESGRVEKRIQLVIPLQIVGINDRGASEGATTENVCSWGVRIVAQRPLNPSERLLIIPPSGERHALVRVVYCERLPDGAYAAGLQFEGEGIRWSKEWSVGFGT